LLNQLDAAILRAAIFGRIIRDGRGLPQTLGHEGESPMSCATSHRTTACARFSESAWFAVVLP